MEDDECYWKLKDNIPLEELKKYKFKKDAYCLYYSRQIDNCWYDKICINLHDRILYRARDVVGYSEIYWDVQEYIQDLIDTGIVEKKEW